MPVKRRPFNLVIDSTIARDGSISWNAKALYTLIGFRARGQGWCYWRVDRLAADLGLSVHQTRRALVELNAGSWLDRQVEGRRVAYRPAPHERRLRGLFESPGLAEGGAEPAADGRSDPPEGDQSPAPAAGPQAASRPADEARQDRPRRRKRRRPTRPAAEPAQEPAQGAEPAADGRSDPPEGDQSPAPAAGPQSGPIGDPGHIKTGALTWGPDGVSDDRLPPRPAAARAADAAGPGRAARDPADELFDRAVEVVVQDQRASPTALQRQLGIGYAEASRLIDRMHRELIVGEYGGSTRRVLLTPEQWAASRAIRDTLDDGAQPVDNLSTAGAAGDGFVAHAQTTDRACATSRRACANHETEHAAVNADEAEGSRDAHAPENQQPKVKEKRAPKTADDPDTPTAAADVHPFDRKLPATLEGRVDVNDWRAMRQALRAAGFDDTIVERITQGRLIPPTLAQVEAALRAVGRVKRPRDRNGLLFRAIDEGWQ